MVRRKIMEPLDKIKEMVKKAGSQKAVAIELDISQVYLSDILKGNRNISESVAKKLGFKRSWIAAVREDAPMAKEK
jgi:plasmid maintenance system antidote protein VapI